MKAPVSLITLLFLAACGDSGDAPVQSQRISLEDSRAKPDEPLPSPNTRGAGWRVSENGRSIDFGQAGQGPLLSLVCDLREDPVRLTIVRHAPARPGQKALFPVIGNGMVSRFRVDAALSGGEWRWEEALPASDPLLDVFAGPLELEATLPGGGMLVIAGSTMPGEFVNWCRSGGEAAEPTEDEGKEAASPAPPAG